MNTVRHETYTPPEPLAAAPAPVSRGVGVLWIVLGIGALLLPALATVASAFVLGVFLLVAGAGHVVNAFRGAHKAWHGVWAALTLLAGGILMFAPVQGAVSLTLVLGVWLLLGGFLRLGMAVSMAQARGWMAVSAVTGILLGGLLIASWPMSGVWAIGIFLGVDFLVGGIAALMR